MSWSRHPLPVGRACVYFFLKKLQETALNHSPIVQSYLITASCNKAPTPSRARFREGRRRKPHSPASTRVGGAKAGGETKRACCACVEVFPVALGISHPRQPTHTPEPALISACRRQTSFCAKSSVGWTA
ncbi:hypothetical protein LY76DRAFT_65501 [Colletotrichum caudatum]|nr:hypothetical protein LY76DRAFT_65501 [Colletotrichum caudatum]